MLLLEKNSRTLSKYDKGVDWRTPEEKQFGFHILTVRPTEQI